MKNIRKELELICTLFNLGALVNWKSTTNIVGGLNEIIFDTENFTNQKFYINPEKL